MKFRTEIQIPLSDRVIDYSSAVLAMGSCFASSIGGKLLDSKFTTQVNPTGVLFNPLSICATLQRFKECRTVSIDQLRKGQDGWFHFDFHGSLSDSDPLVALEKINGAVNEGSRALSECSTIIITFGTAWIYELIESGRVVANCHKEPSRSFSRRAMSVAEIVDEVGQIVESYPEKEFIFSLSPIRHLKDGLSENSLSKATLRVAIAQIVERYANASYFPSCEILMDDLRDYRFYADDMLHPSAQAVEYIWSKFCDSHISASARATMSKVANIVRAAAHRPLNDSSEAYREFCAKELELIKELPNLDFGKESAYFMSQLQKKL